MKVIFLDNDGVLCLYKNYGSRFIKQKKLYGNFDISEKNQLDIITRFDNLDQKAVKTFNEILEKTGAEYVVSSDWRKYATLDELGFYYLSQNIIKRPIGFTDFFNYKKWENNGLIPEGTLFPRHANEQERYFEILKWLKEHPEVTHWVAIDDMNLAKKFKDYSGEVERDWGLENFVRTDEIEGIKRLGTKEKIINFLK